MPNHLEQVWNQMRNSAYQRKDLHRTAYAIYGFLTVEVGYTIFAHQSATCAFQNRRKTNWQLGKLRPRRDFLPGFLICLGESWDQEMPAPTEQMPLEPLFPTSQRHRTPCVGWAALIGIKLRTPRQASES